MRRRKPMYRALAAAVLAAALMSGLVFCVLGCSIPSPEQLVSNFVNQVAQNAINGVGGYLYGAAPTEGAAIQGAVQLAARAGVGVSAEQTGTNLLSITGPIQRAAGQTIQRATTGSVGRSRILVSLLDRQAPVGTGNLSFDVVCGMDGNFTIPALPEGERVGLTAVPPEGAPTDQYQQSQQQEYTIASGSRGRILSALGLADLGTLPPVGVDVTQYFPLNIGDVRVYQQLDSYTYAPISVVPEYVGAQVNLFDLNGQPLAGGKQPYLFLQPSDPQNYTGMVAGDFWLNSTAGIEYYGQADFSETAQAVTARVLDPPLTFPNNLNMGATGEAAPGFHEGYVGLAGTASTRQGGTGIYYQLVEVSTQGNPYRVPAGEFSDWIRTRYAFQYAYGAYFVLEYVLAKGVGIIERADYLYDPNLGRDRPSAFVTQLVSAIVNGQEVGGFAEQPQTAPPQMEVWSHYDGVQVDSSVQYLYGSVYSLDAITDLVVTVNGQPQSGVTLDTGMALASRRLRKGVSARMLPGEFTVPTDRPAVLEFPFYGEIQLNSGANAVRIVATTQGGVTGEQALNINLAQAAGGQVEIEVRWDKADADVDSYIIGPDGVIYRAYYNPYGPGLEIQDSTSLGPEITRIAATQPGTYSFGIAGYLVPTPPANVNARITYNGAPLGNPIQKQLTDQIAGNAYLSTDPTGSFVSLFQLQVSGAGSPPVVMPAAPLSAFQLDTAGQLSVRSAAKTGK